MSTFGDIVEKNIDIRWNFWLYISLFFHIIIIPISSSKPYSFWENTAYKYKYKKEKKERGREGTRASELLRNAALAMVLYAWSLSPCC